MTLLKSTSDMDPDALLKAQGSALRVIYRPGTGTESHSKEVRSAIEPFLGRDPFVSRRYRVEASRVAHDDIPRLFGSRRMPLVTCRFLRNHVN